MGVIVVFAVSCDSHRVSNPNPLELAAQDSSLFDSGAVTIKTIKVGERITNKPTSSQIVMVNGREKYLMLDESTIYVFDWSTGEIEDSITVKGCGLLNNYSGFTYVNGDTLFVYNYRDKTLFMQDSSGVIRGEWILREGRKEKRNGIDVEALNGTRILYGKRRIVLSGSYFGPLERRGSQNVSEWIAVSDRHAQAFCSYPELYREGNWGGVYMNMVTHALMDDGRCAFSFPIDHYVYCYDPLSGRCDTIYMGSRYTTDIKESEEDAFDLLADKDSRIRYFISQHSYGPVLYDSYRHLLLRVAYHPLANWNSKGSFEQPVSILAADPTRGLLSESFVIKDFKRLNITNMHVCKDGIAVAQDDDKDENQITFRCYRLSTNNL